NTGSLVAVNAGEPSERPCGSPQERDCADLPDQILGRLFVQHRDRLRRMVQLRLDQRLQGRLDPSDVIQQAWIDAVQRFDEFQQQRELSPYVWIRFLTGQKLAQLHRHHLGTQMRQASRDVSLFRGALPSATSAVLAAQLVGKLTSPSAAVVREEQRLKVESALNGMEDHDREVLSLRHFEQLSNAETAEILGLSQDACYKRYVRALMRLKAVLGDDSEVR
ncbi:MAG: sigma-70 family RNA polymerase sigma factor, partial [Planctomycetaceae bacterium]|nr:sigma-70 family RNA polymerase sigma factor [Planctomycetaceae bacterium]